MLINKVTNVKPHILPLKDRHGSTLFTVDEQIPEWQKHYECSDETAEKAGNESDVNPRNNLNRRITTEPPSIAINRLNLNKAAGPNGIFSRVGVWCRRSWSCFKTTTP